MTTAPATRLARLIRDGVFTEEGTLISAGAGSYNDFGEFQTGAGQSSTVKLVTAPVTGRERETLPEGLREKNLRTFYLATQVRATEEGDGGIAGDIIEYNGTRWRVVQAQDWGGFWSCIGEQV